MMEYLGKNPATEDDRPDMGMERKIGGIFREVMQEEGFRKEIREALES